MTISDDKTSAQSVKDACFINSQITTNKFDEIIISLLVTTKRVGKENIVFKAAEASHKYLSTGLNPFHNSMFCTFRGFF
jgi:hypothetical protein